MRGDWVKNPQFIGRYRLLFFRFTIKYYRLVLNQDFTSLKFDIHWPIIIGTVNQ